MSDINLNLKSVADLKAIDVVDKLSEGNELKSGKIKIKGKTYNMSVIKEGAEQSINVTREYTGWFANFRNKHCTKNTHTAINFSRHLKTVLDSREYAVVGNSYHTLLEIAKNDKTNRRNIEVADYGLAPNRKLLSSQKVAQVVNSRLAAMNIQKTVSLNMIDTYNNLGGFTYSSLNINNYADTMQRVENGLKIDNKKFNHLHHTVDKEQLKKYHNFLSKPENLEKINIPKKLYNYLHQDEPLKATDKQTGWKAEFKRNPDEALKNFVIKNTHFAYRGNKELILKSLPLIKDYVAIMIIKDQQKRDEKLIELAQDERWLDKQEKKKHDEKIKQIIKKYKATPQQAKTAYAKAHSLKEDSKLFRFVNSVICYATFRQTSKLGLEFFRGEKVPVMFQFSDFFQKDLEGEEYQKIEEDKFWNQSKLNEDGAGSAITHSELRKVARMRRENLDFDVRMVHGGKE